MINTSNGTDMVYEKETVVKGCNNVYVPYGYIMVILLLEPIPAILENHRRIIWLDNARWYQIISKTCSTRQYQGNVSRDKFFDFL